MKFSSASAIILAALIFGGENAIVQGKNAKEFQERRRQLLRKNKKNNKYDQAAPPLDMAAPMEIQKESRQESLSTMMDEEENMYMDASKGPPEDMPVYYFEDEDEYEGEVEVEYWPDEEDYWFDEAEEQGYGATAMDGESDGLLYFDEYYPEEEEEDFESEDMMPASEGALDEDTFYTQEDMEMMMGYDNNIDTTDGEYYPEDALYFEEFEGGDMMPVPEDILEEDTFYTQEDMEMMLGVDNAAMMEERESIMDEEEGDMWN